MFKQSFSNEAYVSVILAESADDIDLVLTRLRVPNLPVGRTVSVIEDEEFVDDSTAFEKSFDAITEQRQTNQSDNGQTQKSKVASASSRGRMSLGATRPRTEAEPPKVRTGSRRQSAAASQRSHRAVTYVAGEQANGLKGSSRDTDTRSAVDAAAIEQVEQHEKQRRLPTVMTHFNEGYDIESRCKLDGEIERYIEVKGLGGAWSDFGVKLTPAQIRFGTEKGDSHWLYIVEFALDASRSVIHMIQDPVKKITDYRFDAGWRHLTEESTGFRRLAPEIDSRVQIVDEGHGKIISLRKHGELMRLTIKMDNGCELKRNYPSNDITIVEE